MSDNRYRTIFISDVHLGTRGSKAEYLVNFLKNNNSEKLYLIGDIVDGWRLKKRWYWPQAHNNVIRRILTKAKRDTEVVYVTGNHDEFLRPFTTFGLKVGNIKIVDEDIYTTINGKELWIVHGDFFDGVTRYHKWLALLGDQAYVFLIWANVWLNRLRQRLGMGYWSLSSYLKHKAKKAVNFIYEFETAVAHECKRRGHDGVVCGHIHKAEIKDINGILYANAGDWVESCTALVEHFDGRLEIIEWAR